jgi:hypothetical protein
MHVTLPGWPSTQALPMLSTPARVSINNQKKKKKKIKEKEKKKKSLRD